MTSKLITIKEAAKILNISKLTLRNWDNEGKLKAYRHPINNYRIYRLEDIEQIIKTIESGEKPVRSKNKLKIKTRIIPVVHIKD